MFDVQPGNVNLRAVGSEGAVFQHAGVANAVDIAQCTHGRLGELREAAVVRHVNEETGDPSMARSDAGVSGSIVARDHPRRVITSY